MPAGAADLAPQCLFFAAFGQNLVGEGCTPAFPADRLTANEAGATGRGPKLLFRRDAAQR